MKKSLPVRLPRGKGERLSSGRKRQLAAFRREMENPSTAADFISAMNAASDAVQPLIDEARFSEAEELFGIGRPNIKLRRDLHGILKEYFYFEKMGEATSKEELRYELKRISKQAQRLQSQLRPFTRRQDFKSPRFSLIWTMDESFEKFGVNPVRISAALDTLVGVEAKLKGWKNPRGRRRQPGWSFVIKSLATLFENYTGKRAPLSDDYAKGNSLKFIQLVVWMDKEIANAMLREPATKKNLKSKITRVLKSRAKIPLKLLR